jgi:hypothetical protein
MLGLDGRVHVYFLLRERGGSAFLTRRLVLGASGCRAAGADVIDERHLVSVDAVDPAKGMRLGSDSEHCDEQTGIHYPDQPVGWFPGEKRAHASNTFPSAA